MRRFNFFDKKIIFLDKDNLYIYHKNQVVKSEFKKTRGIVTATYPYEKVYNLNFKLPQTISEEMLEIEAEKYVFTQGALDLNKEYKIVYTFNKIGLDYIVDAFIVDVEEEKEYFKEYKKVFKYINYVSIAPFVFESFYKFNNPKVDVFIYLNEDDAFLSCFKDGKLLFVKGLNKLSILSKSLNVDREKLASILKNQGLDEESYEDRFIFDYVNNFFSEFFMKVSNILTHSINFYALEKIDRVYFYSPFEIKDIFKTYEDYFKVTGIDFKKYEINSQIDPFVYSAILYNVDHLNDKNNISVYAPSLPFYKRRVGQLAIFAFMIMALLGADLGWRYYKVNQQKEILMELKSKYKLREQKAKGIEKQIALKKKEVNELLNKIKILEDEYMKIDNNLKFLYSIIKSPLLSNDMDKILYALSKNDLKLVSISKSKNQIILEVASRENTSYYIGIFMKDLIRLGFKDVSSSFVKNENSNYISQVSFYDK